MLFARALDTDGLRICKKEGDEAPLMILLFILLFAKAFGVEGRC